MWSLPKKPPTIAWRFRRGALPVAAALALLLLPGCIFLRLSRALDDFRTPRAAVVFAKDKEGWEGRVQNPIALLSDVEYVLGIKTEKVAEGHYRYEFSKSGPADRQPWNADLYVDAEGRITAVRLPPRLHEVLGEDFLYAFIRALGRSSVAVSEKTLRLEMAEELEFSKLFELMGAASEKQEDRSVYRFNQGGLSYVVQAWGTVKVEKMIIDVEPYHLVIAFGVQEPPPRRERQE